jgi:hypothetical protein
MQQTSMCRLMALTALAVAVVLFITPKTALGQDVPFAICSFSNAQTTGAPDATLRLVNDGAGGDASPAGDLCAAIYVFNFDEQLAECCSCKVTPNGLLTLSVDLDLTSNPLTPRVPHRGVIKTISSAVPSDGVCDPRAVVLKAGIKGWITHVQNAGAGKWSITEDSLTNARLGLAEFSDLQDDCANLIELGSGFGSCDCTDRTI